MKVEEIFAVVMVSLVFVPIILGTVKTKHRKKALLNKVKINPKCEEKIRVAISRSECPSSLIRSPMERFCVFWFLILFLFLLVVFSFNILGDGTLWCFWALLALMAISITIYDSVYIRKMLKKWLINYYQRIIDVSFSKNEVIFKHDNDSKQVCNYRCMISDYKCVLTYFYDKKLFFFRFNNRGYTDYSRHYKKVCNYISYDYDLTAFNLSAKELSAEVIVSWLKEETNYRYIVDIKFNNGHLIIIKETVLYGYSDIDAKRDALDVKFFYDIIISNLKKEEVLW